MPSEVRTALRGRIVEHVERDDADHAEIRDAVVAHDAETPDEDHTELIAAHVEYVAETTAGHERLVALSDQHVADIDG